MRICPACKVRKIPRHLNAKKCRPCAAELRKRPKHNLTPSQQAQVMRFRGKLTKEQIAERIGASRSSIMRFGRELGLSMAATYKYKANPNLVQQVCEFYKHNGKLKTGKNFPGVNVRSVVERYPHAPRQVRWTDDQVKELARMAGLVSHASQAKYFKRPNANTGSITSVWMKRFKQSGAQLNGLSWNNAKHLVTKRCKPITTAFWYQRASSSRDEHSRKIVLWVDLKKHLRTDQPQWLREAISSMAKFQIWLHEVENVRPKVIRLIKQRER